MHAGVSEILKRFLGPLRSFLNPCGEFWPLNLEVPDFVSEKLGELVKILKDLLNVLGL